MRWIQITIPHPMAALLLDCVKVARRVMPFKAVDDKALMDLQDFLEYADENPNAFPPTGTMASSLKTRARRVDGIRRNDGTLKTDEPREHTKRAHRKTSRPSRHQRRLNATKERKENRAASIAEHNSHVASDRLVAQPERKGILARLGLGRAEAQDPNAGV
jgi:hypothetical protein